MKNNQIYDGREMISKATINKATNKATINKIMMNKALIMDLKMDDLANKWTQE